MAPTPPHNCGQRPRAGQALTLRGHGPTVDAAPLARSVAEGWGPAREAVAVLVVVADLEGAPGRGISTLESSGLPQGGTPAAQPQGPGQAYPVAIALLPTAFHFKEGGVPALSLEANLQ